MKQTTPVLVIAPLLLAACAGEVTRETDAKPAAAIAPDATAAAACHGLCLSAAMRQRLADTQAALAACVPGEGSDPTGSGLRVAAIELAGIDGGAAELSVTLANVSSAGTFSYPGLAVAGDAAVEPREDWRYGVMPCGRTVSAFHVPLAGPTSLAAEAVNGGYGKTVVDRVDFEVAP